MKSFLRRFADSIHGVLNGFDRIRFRGTQRLLASVRGLSRFLSYQHVLLKDFKPYVTGITDAIRQQVEDGAVRGQEGAHRAFTDVFYIPVLKSSVISLGQLDESWYDIRIHHGILTLRDSQDRLLAQVPRLSNRLYKLSFNLVQPVCLAAQHDSES